MNGEIIFSTKNMDLQNNAGSMELSSRSTSGNEDVKEKMEVLTGQTYVRGIGHKSVTRVAEGNEARIRQIEELEIVYDCLANLTASRSSRDKASEELRRHSLMNALNGMTFSKEDSKVFIDTFQQTVSKDELFQQKGGLLHEELKKFSCNTLIQSLGISYNTVVSNENYYSGAGTQEVDSSEVGIQSAAKKQYLDNDLKEGINSDRDICNLITSLIDAMGSEYLGVYEQIVEVMTEFWSDFSNKIIAKMADWTSTYGSGSSSGGIQVSLAFPYTLRDDFLNNNSYILYSSGNKDEADAWREDLNLPLSCEVYNSSTGMYELHVDMSVIQVMYDEAMKNSVIGFPMMFPDMTSYQAWLTGFNSQIENIKTDVQTMTTKYSTANSMYDTVVKLLTSTITTLLESAKEYLRF